MKYFRTPFEIVKIMRKHLPIRQMKILEPAVGEGALLETLDSVKAAFKITAIDIDPARLKALKYSYEEIELINDDFLRWSETCNAKYDLVLINPPFSAKSKDWVFYKNKKIPIELLFFIKSLELLDLGGTLLAIVPDVIINSSTFVEERKEIFFNNKISYVYQLPKRVFKSIESGFYLIVVKKGGRTNKISMRKANENGYDQILVSKNEVIKNNYRLDFSYYFSSRFYDVVSSGHKELAFNELGKFCDIKRGGIRECYQRPGLIHTCSFENGVWGKAGRVTKDLKNYCVMVKRVSRNAHLTFGIADKEDIVKATDCVVTILSSKIDPFKLLFFLRVFYSNSYGEEFILKGTGAKFISVKQLCSLKYFDLASIYRKEFGDYCEELLSNNFLVCKEIERHVFLRFFLKGKVSPIFDRSQIKNDGVKKNRAIECSII